MHASDAKKLKNQDPEREIPRPPQTKKKRVIHSIESSLDDGKPVISQQKQQHSPKLQKKRKKKILDKKTSKTTVGEYLCSFTDLELQDRQDLALQKAQSNLVSQYIFYFLFTIFLFPLFRKLFS